MATEIIIRQLLMFGILIAIGALAFWRKIITSEIKNNLARIVIDVTLPFLIFSTFANMEYDPKLIKNGLLVFGLAFSNLFILYWLGKLSSRILRLNVSQETVHSLHTMLGNIVFLGFPLLDALFPDGLGVFYAAVYQLASNAVTFTFGVYKLSSGTHKGGWKSLINPNTIGLFLGALVLVSGFTLPSVIRKAVLQGSIYALAFNKLLLAPVLLGALYLFILNIIGIEISKVAFFVIMLQAAMPCQTIVVVLSHRYNGDHQLAGANLFVTTLLSIVTLPLVYYLLEWIWLNI